MRQIDLDEHGTTSGVPLSRVELDALQRYEQQRQHRQRRRSKLVSVTPTTGHPGRYDLQAGSTVGAVDFQKLSIRIRPKLPVGRLIALLAYATDAVDLTGTSDFAKHDELVEAVAAALDHEARRAFAQGLLHGYRTTEEALPAVRGRIRFDEQVRRRFGLAPPIEVRHDDYTADITANRLVKAAVARIGRMRIRHRRNRDALRWTAAALADVTHEEYRSTAVPTVTFDRLNRHYRRVVALARIVLQGSAFEANRGDDVRAPGFLVDMNRLFERFVVRALREALGASDRTLRSGVGTTLDEQGRIRLEPDLSWWPRGVCARRTADLRGQVPTEHARDEAHRQAPGSCVHRPVRLAPGNPRVRGAGSRPHSTGGGRRRSACPPRVTARRAGRTGQDAAAGFTVFLAAHPEEPARLTDGSGMDRPRPHTV